VIANDGDGGRGVVCMLLSIRRDPPSLQPERVGRAPPVCLSPPVPTPSLFRSDPRGDDRPQDGPTHGGRPAAQGPPRRLHRPVPLPPPTGCVALGVPPWSPPPERGLRRTARDPLGPRCLRRPVTVAPRHSAMRRTGEPRPVHADPDHGRGKEGRTAFRKGGGHNTGGGRRWVAGGRPWGEAPDAPLRDGLIRFFFPQSEVL